VPRLEAKGLIGWHDDRNLAWSKPILDQAKKTKGRTKPKGFLAAMWSFAIDHSCDRQMAPVHEISTRFYTLTIQEPREPLSMFFLKK
jgi:hypothetical protein